MRHRQLHQISLRIPVQDSFFLPFIALMTVGMRLHPVTSLAFQWCVICHLQRRLNSMLKRFDHLSLVSALIPTGAFLLALTPMEACQRAQPWDIKRTINDIAAIVELVLVTFQVSLHNAQLTIDCANEHNLRKAMVSIHAETKLRWSSLFSTEVNFLYRWQMTDNYKPAASVLAVS